MTEPHLDFYLSLKAVTVLNPTIKRDADWTALPHSIKQDYGASLDISQALPLMVDSPESAMAFPWDVQSVASCLALQSPPLVQMLVSIADQIRAARVGDGVHLRALIEISNHCERSCHYCGLFSGNKLLGRYRLEKELILEVVDSAVAMGYGTVVLQSGEDSCLDGEWVESLIRAIRAKHGDQMAITLGLGEREREDLVAWKQAGADRYLLKQETIDADLYTRLHPKMSQERRVSQLRLMKELGYQIGSGVMVGLPGQTWEILARDLLFMRDLDMDMVGCGPLIVHPATPLAKLWQQRQDGRFDGDGRLGWEIEPDVENSLKVVAMARILMPNALLPVTTSLATLDREQGRERALRAGANVIMPDVTPVEYRGLYEIYPGKACVSEKAEACRSCLEARLASIGRHIAAGPGHRHR